MKLLAPPTHPAAPEVRKRLPDPIRVAVVGDGAPGRQSVIRRTAGTVAGIHCTGVLGLDDDLAGDLPKLDPQVVLMRAATVAEPVVKTLEQLVREFPSVPVLLISADTGYAAIAAAFRAGASGYLLESPTANELWDAIRAILQGGSPISPAVARRLVESFRPSRPAAGLTPREKQVLELVATGLVNKEIAQRLCISVETVRHHLKQIYGKFGVGTRTQAAMKYCRTAGFSA